MLVSHLNKRNGRDINFKKLYINKEKKRFKNRQQKNHKAFDVRGIKAKNRCFFKHVIER